MKIISGGQTGADRAGLDFAIRHGIEHGGWCPKGRLAEDGSIPGRYNLRETESDKYPPRTAANIKEGDVTLVFNMSEEMERGCALTIELCSQMKKPVWIYPALAQKLFALHTGRAFLAHHKPQVINVAGNRESKSPGINAFVIEFLEGLLL